MKLLVFDTETTGIPSKKPLSATTCHTFPHVVQLSWTLYDTETHEHTEHDYLIKVSVPIKNAHIHGITNAKSDTGVSMEEAFDAFKVDLDQCDLLVGHNVSFDLRMMEIECMRMSREWHVPVPTHCTMMTNVAYCGLSKWPKLSELYTHCFHEPVANLHNSMVDVVVCLRCYMHIKHEIDVCDMVPEWKVMLGRGEV